VVLGLTFAAVVAASSSTPSSYAEQTQQTSDAAAVGQLVWVVLSLGLLAFILPRVGYRWFDTFMFGIPIFGIVLLTQSLWRLACWRRHYWSERPERAAAVRMAPPPQPSSPTPVPSGPVDQLAREVDIPMTQYAPGPAPHPPEPIPPQPSWMPSQAPPGWTFNGAPAPAKNSSLKWIALATIIAALAAGAFGIGLGYLLFRADANSATGGCKSVIEIARRLDQANTRYLDAPSNSAAESAALDDFNKESDAIGRVIDNCRSG
jgi:hypothetical protein